MKKFNVLVLAATGFLLTNCAGIYITPSKELNGLKLAPGTEAVAHIRADNWGYFLFKYIPLVCGNPDQTGPVPWPVFFRDLVDQDLLIERLTNESKKLGADLTADLRSTDKSEWLGYTGIIWLNEIEVSGNALKTQK